MSLAIAITAVGFLVWTVVAYRAWRYSADIVLLALVLTVCGLIAAQLLGLAGVEAPGAWAFLATGIVLLLLWPKGGMK